LALAQTKLGRKNRAPGRNIKKRTDYEIKIPRETSTLNFQEFDAIPRAPKNMVLSKSLSAMDQDTVQFLSAA